LIHDPEKFQWLIQYFNNLLLRQNSVQITISKLGGNCACHDQGKNQPLTPLVAYGFCFSRPRGIQRGVKQWSTAEAVVSNAPDCEAPAAMADPYGRGCLLLLRTSQNLRGQIPLE